ncbi:MAG TPA: Gfo/Idh/MocA family oxidoreductase [Xanthobacteraceae bacterium]|nr:Gfo/Idh/MocA family oxidoreductase [Xanthobacteraceae bacterium]
MLRAGIIGLGKMGLSHLAIANTHPEIRLTAVCDTTNYLLDVLAKYTGVKTYSNYKKMLVEEQLDCVFVATPSKYHVEIVDAALERNLHVFCEKPFGMNPSDGYRLADLAESKGLANQVGYHYRFVAAFNEAKRLLDLDAIGDIHHVRIEAYGPVVLRKTGATWRSKRSEGGGCLFDYACHAIDLVNYVVGRPSSVSGTVLNSVFSSDVDDEVYSTLQFPGGASGQLAANWSDDSYRKMSVKLSMWGTNGRISADRQELQIYVRSLPKRIDSLSVGWNVRYTTELTPPVWFYARGEEYSAQIDHFVQCITNGKGTVSSFRSASDASLVAALMRTDADKFRTPIQIFGNAPGVAPITGKVGEKSRERSLIARLLRGERR